MWERRCSVRATANGSSSPIWPITICQPGKAVEEAADHHPQAVARGLDRERPGRAEQRLAALVVAALVRQRVARVQVEGDAERRDPLPERQVLRFVVVGGGLEVADARVAVDEGAAEAELGDAALELGGRPLGVLQRQRREADVAVGVGGDDRGEGVVGGGAPSRSRRPGRRCPGCRGRRARSRRSRSRPRPCRRAGPRRSPAGRRPSPPTRPPPSRSSRRSCPSAPA